MEVFYTTLILTFILSLLSRIFSYRDKRIERLTILIPILILILIAGLRLNIGDTGAYVEGYEGLKDFKGFDENSKDIGFIIFTIILYKISINPQFMIFVTSFITQFFNIYTLAKYRNFFELQIYMYITSGYYLTTMNGIRQSMVAAILFACVKLIEKRNFKLYLIITLILSTMHRSVLIMIPIYFIVRKEAWSKHTIIIICISAIGFLFFYQLVPVLFDILGEQSQYSHYEDAFLTGGEGGATVMRFIVNSVPVVLSYIYRKRLKELWPKSNIFVNMSIINLIFMAFSLYNWIFARFSIYFQLYNFVLLPFIIKNCFKEKKERDLIYYLFLVCYFIFFYREQVIGEVGLGYKSDFF